MQVPEWKLNAFSWLPLEKWNQDQLIGPDTYCKVCDERIPESKQITHIKGHIKQMKAIIKKRDEENKKKRLEALAEARRLKKEAKDAIS